MIRHAERGGACARVPAAVLDFLFLIVSINSRGAALADYLADASFFIKINECYRT
jgi:hypothetical protein